MSTAKRWVRVTGVASLFDLIGIPRSLSFYNWHSGPIRYAWRIDRLRSLMHSWVMRKRDQASSNWTAPTYSHKPYAIEYRVSTATKNDPGTISIPWRNNASFIGHSIADQITSTIIKLDADNSAGTNVSIFKDIDMEIGWWNDSSQRSADSISSRITELFLRHTVVRICAMVNRVSENCLFSLILWYSISKSALCLFRFIISHLDHADTRHVY